MMRERRTVRALDVMGLVVCTTFITLGWVDVTEAATSSKDGAKPEGSRGTPDQHPGSPFRRLWDAALAGEAGAVWELTCPDAYDETLLPEEKDESRARFAQAWLKARQGVGSVLRGLVNASAVMKVYAVKQVAGKEEHYFAVTYPDSDNAYKPEPYLMVRKVKGKAVVAGSGRVEDVQVLKHISIFEEETRGLTLKHRDLELSRLAADGLEHYAHLYDVEFVQVNDGSLSSLTQQKRILPDGRIVQEGFRATKTGAYAIGKVKNALDLNAMSVRVVAVAKTRTVTSVTTGTWLDLLGGKEVEEDAQEGLCVIRDLKPGEIATFAIHLPGVEASSTLAAHGIEVATRTRYTGSGVRCVLLPTSEQASVLVRHYLGMAQSAADQRDYPLAADRLTRLLRMDREGGIESHVADVATRLPSSYRTALWGVYRGVKEVNKLAFAPGGVQFSIWLKTYGYVERTPIVGLEAFRLEPVEPVVKYKWTWLSSDGKVAANYLHNALGPSSYQLYDALTGDDLGSRFYTPSFRCFGANGSHAVMTRHRGQKSLSRLYSVPDLKPVGPDLDVELGSAPACAPDGCVLADSVHVKSADSGHYLRLIDLARGEVCAKHRLEAGGVQAISFSYWAASKIVCVVHGRGLVSLFRTLQDGSLWQITTFRSPINTAGKDYYDTNAGAISPDGRYIALGGEKPASVVFRVLGGAHGLPSPDQAATQANLAEWLKANRSEVWEQFFPARVEASQAEFERSCMEYVHRAEETDGASLAAAETLNGIGAYFRDVTKYERALKAFQVSLTKAAEAAKDEGAGGGQQRSSAAADPASLQAQAHCYQAECYEQLAKRDPKLRQSALAAYERAFSQFPRTSAGCRAAARLGGLYYIHEDYVSAIRVYKKILDLYQHLEQRDLVILNIGKVRVMMKEYERAAERFKEVIEKHPDSEHAAKAQRYLKYTERRISDARMPKRSSQYILMRGRFTGSETEYFFLADLGATGSDASVDTFYWSQRKHRIEGVRQFCRKDTAAGAMVLTGTRVEAIDSTTGYRPDTFHVAVAEDGNVKGKLRSGDSVGSCTGRAVPESGLSGLWRARSSEFSFQLVLFDFGDTIEGACYVSYDSTIVYQSISGVQDGDSLNLQGSKVSMLRGGARYSPDKFRLRVAAGGQRLEGKWGTTLGRPISLKKATGAVTSLAGSWEGHFAYPRGDERSPVKFRAELRSEGGGIVGKLIEPNTFSQSRVKELRANVVDFRADPDGSVQFVKEYDGTGGETHRVDYRGSLSKDRRTIRGTWRMPRLSGTFEMRRE